ncbi:hypothetical protein [Stenotrophomonas sp. SKA14]|uniref:P-loop ATPase, Sll1717 family n=1 Tax=Stenotrophomonas sp. SKA14 TaxID=391601 RepID=UPI0002E802C2|nr:hypothetical protein [Stenotrophomonas sp. SKA14]
MKEIKDLERPHNDALNYKHRKEKDLFNKIFLRTVELDEIIRPSTYFLMGEKGSGKTAYAVYMENNKYKDHICHVTTMTETQYHQFIQLKRAGKLNYSDYANIWRSMLLFIVARTIVSQNKDLLSSITGKFKKVEASIRKWAQNSMSPEVETAFNAIIKDFDEVNLQAPEVASIKGGRHIETSTSSVKLKSHLLDRENDFKESISSLKLGKNHILFFDGIDYRPEQIPYQEYVQCIKGLGEAVWQLNSEFFPSIRDSKGRLKIVLLVRPDVFHALNLYNSNSRFQDNTVFLEWSTPEKEYQSSNLFEMAGKFFASQQPIAPAPADAWRHYYENGQRDAASFRRFLRISFQKPRDALTFIRITINHTVKSGRGSDSRFPPDAASSHAFSRDYADYLLGEAKNYAAFYMTQEDFYKYVKFFQFLNGQHTFDFEVFERAYVRFKAWAQGENFNATAYLRDSTSLLQLFYDMNIIGFYEEAEDKSERFVHWSFRDRSLNNIAPKVKSEAMLTLNAGISKALEIGKQLKSNASDSAKPREMRTDRRRRAPRRRKPKAPAPTP